MKEITKAQYNALKVILEDFPRQEFSGRIAGDINSRTLNALLEKNIIRKSPYVFMGFEDEQCYLANLNIAYPAYYDYLELNSGS